MQCHLTTQTRAHCITWDKKKSVSQREPLVDLHICNTFNSSYIWGNNVRIFAYVCQTLLLNLFAKSVLFTHIL